MSTQATLARRAAFTEAGHEYVATNLSLVDTKFQVTYTDVNAGTFTIFALVREVVEAVHEYHDTPWFDEVVSFVTENVSHDDIPHPERVVDVTFGDTMASFLVAMVMGR